MIVTVAEDDTQAIDRCTDQLTLDNTGSKTFFDGRNVFSGNVSSSDLALELEGTIFIRSYCSNDATKLSRSTGLLLVSVVVISDLSNSLTEGDLRCSNFDFGFELTLHAFDVNLKVKFSHS